MIAWTPRDGETVHLRRDNPFGGPAGRYVLRAYRGEPGDVIHGEPFDLVEANGAASATSAPELRAMERASILTPIDPAQLERDRQALALRTHAPLRGLRTGAMRAQHDASALPLFTAANELRLF